MLAGVCRGQETRACALSKWMGRPSSRLHPPRSTGKEDPGSTAPTAKRRRRAWCIVLEPAQSAHKAHGVEVPSSHTSRAAYKKHSCIAPRQRIRDSLEQVPNHFERDRVPVNRNHHQATCGNERHVGTSYSRARTTKPSRPSAEQLPTALPRNCDGRRSAGDTHSKAAV